MKKFSSLFFAAYNAFLILVCIFNWFNFSTTEFRLLLALEALQVVMYKLIDYYNNKQSSPLPPPSIEHISNSITIVRKAIYHHPDEEYDIKKILARQLTDELVENNYITFLQYNEEKDFKTTVAEIKIAK